MEESRMELKMGTDSRNEAFARAVTAAFLIRFNPSVEEMEDIKTSVSEAVSNAILHGYDCGDGEVRFGIRVCGDCVTVSVEDDGIGIEDVEKAREPLFTTKPTKDRSGMGFYFMEAFMDHVEVESAPAMGTRITMTKRIGRR